MASNTEEWHPGSFTKNFSWGSNRGLKELYEVIRTGFAKKLEDVSRKDFISRVKGSGRPYYIPVNFFLFNRTIDGEDRLLVDELVFQAINFPHSARFDALALFSFVLSNVGSWKGAESYQQTPALWAKHYVSDRLARDFNWDASKINADDIERFVFSDKRYKAKSARKLATNLNHLFKVGKIKEFNSQSVSRWWTDAIFLTLDRSIESRSAQKRSIQEEKYETYLAAAGFFQISGTPSIEKDLAAKHVVNLFRACGSRGRFSDDSVRELIKTALSDVESWISNNPEPIAAIHLTNPNIIKTIPSACAMLAHSVGFQTFDLDQLAELNVADLVRENLERSLKDLKEKGISPQISAEDLMKLMRGE